MAILIYVLRSAEVEWLTVAICIRLVIGKMV